MKKFRALITNGALIALSVLMFIFMSQPFMSATITIPNIFGSGSTTNTVSTSGYDYLENMSKLKGDDKFVAICVVLVIILASLLMLVALTNLLVNFGIIKNKTVAKILPFVETLLALLAVVFVAAAVGVIKGQIADIPEIARNAYKVGWGVVITLVVTIISLCVAVFDMVLALKKQK